MKQPIGPLLPGTKQVLLTFNEARIRTGQGGRETYHEQPQFPFLPKGLLIWGATADTLIHSIKVGNLAELEIGGFAPIPARYFEQGRSFDELVRLAEAGELELAVEQRQLFEMTEASAGTTISVSISGPYDRFVLWGLTYLTHGRAHRRAVVERLESGFSGRLEEVGLSGIRTLLDVTAPDAATVATLLASLGASKGTY